MVACFTNENICATRRRCCLNGVGSNRDFIHAGLFSTCVDINFSGRFGIRTVGTMIVVFNIIAGDLQVANFTLLDPNATESVVADVITGDVDLVQRRSPQQVWAFSMVDRSTGYKLFGL